MVKRNDRLYPWRCRVQHRESVEKYNQTPKGKAASKRVNDRRIYVGRTYVATLRQEEQEHVDRLRQKAAEFLQRQAEERKNACL